MAAQINCSIYLLSLKASSLFSPFPTPLASEEAF